MEQIHLIWAHFLRAYQQVFEKNVLVLIYLIALEIILLTILILTLTPPF